MINAAPLIIIFSYRATSSNERQLQRNSLLIHSLTLAIIYIRNSKTIQLIKTIRQIKNRHCTEAKFTVNKSKIIKILEILKKLGYKQIAKSINKIHIISIKADIIIINSMVQFKIDNK